MAFTILAQVGEDHPRSVLATTILSYSVSSVLTGIVFFLMGQCKLGVLIGFFPRHILIGCIGGVGFFLIVTAIEVSARLEGNLDYNLDTLKRLVMADTLVLWLIPLFLSLLLFLIKRWVKHSLTDACFFLSVLVIFYILVTAIPTISIGGLRSGGWIFEAPAANTPWYHFYTLYGNLFRFQKNSEPDPLTICRLRSGQLGCFCFDRTSDVCTYLVSLPHVHAAKLTDNVLVLEYSMCLSTFLRLL